MKNGYGFSIWKRPHLENISRPGSIAKCRYGCRPSGMQLIPGLYCSWGTSLVVIIWAFNLFRLDLVKVRELPNSLNTNWTLFTSKTQENFVTVRLPTKERKLAKFDPLYNTKTFSRKTGLSSLKRAIKSSRNFLTCYLAPWNKQNTTWRNNMSKFHQDCFSLYGIFQSGTDQGLRRMVSAREVNY